MANKHYITAMKQGAVTIKSLVSSRLSPGVQLLLAGADSQVWNTFASVGRQQPAAGFTGIEINNLINQFGIAGQAIDATALDLYTVYAAAGGTRAANGEKFSISKGIIVPGRLDAAQAQIATLGYDIFMGGTAADAAPFAVASNQAVPTGLAVAEKFVMGPATINAVARGDIISIGVEFGFQVVQDDSDGDVFPVLVCIDKQEPIIRLRSKEPIALAQIGISGTNDVVTFKLLKQAEGGSRAGAGDLTFTVNEGMTVVEELSGQTNDGAMTEIVVTPTYDGANAPIVVA